MALDPTMMNSAVRITAGTKLGTGFVVSVPSETVPNSPHAYVVTAHHVIAGETRVAVQFPDPFTSELSEPVRLTDWRQPLERVDLALATIPDRLPIRVQTIHRESSVWSDEYEGWPYLGAAIHYVGILSPLDRPMVRTGAIGALDQTGLQHDGGYIYTAHLVDCRSYRGFSGSPCYMDALYPTLEEVELPRHVAAIQPLPRVGAMHHVAVFCGMFTQHLEDDGRTGAVSAYGVGVMLRAEEIWRALMSDAMRDQRKKRDEKRRRDVQPEPRLENASGEQLDEFERFEELTRYLVTTPKPGKQKESEG
jgi:hypothetical protein